MELILGSGENPQNVCKLASVIIGLESSQKHKQL